MKKEPRRIRRERKTVRAMIRIYCRAHCGTGRELCADCSALNDYAAKKIDKCRYFFDKPVCVKCPTHCYKPALKEKIRKVMRYSGPKMIKKHPILAIFHIIDGFKKVNRKPKKNPNADFRITQGRRDIS